MRTRTRVDQPYTYSTVTWGGTWPSSSSILTEYDVSTMTDSNVKGFHSARKKGIMVNNPCGYTRSALESFGSGSFYSQTTNGQYTVSGSGPITRQAVIARGLSYLVPEINTASLLAKAANAALANVDKTPLETGEDVAELGKTLQFLRSPLSSILKELKSVKRTPGKSLYYSLSAGWLTYRFAFSPLVRSVHDILAEHASPTPKPPEIRISHGRSSGEAHVDRLVVVKHPNGYNMDFNATAERSYRVHSYVQYKVKSSTPAWQWRYGLRTKDIPITYWAVFPLSFMIDRVFDVSSLVKSCTNMLDPSIEILGGGTTIHDDVFSTLQYVKEHSPPGWTSSCNGEVSGLHTHLFSRSSSVPTIHIPPLTPKELVKDLTNTLDLITIISGMLRR